MILDNLLNDSNEIIIKVLESINKQQSLLLTYLNQHCFNIYYEDVNYRKVLDSKFLIYQADFGVYLSLKFLFKKKIDRIDATEMNQLILDELIKTKESLVFVGGNFEDKFVREESQKRSINLISYHPGYFDESITNEVLLELSKKNSQVYLIGMGVPKQEIFAAQLAQKVENGVIICVGSFLEYYLGTKKRTHVFFRETGLEWFFRLITEPSRMWKRYLIGIPLFVYRVCKLKSKNFSLISQ